MLSEASFLLSELDRRIAQMIRLGTVAEVDSQAAKVRVKLGENLTGWRPWIGAAGSIKVWRPPVVGEQVVALSPGGDFEQSVILGLLLKVSEPVRRRRPRLSRLG